MNGNWPPGSGLRGRLLAAAVAQRAPGSPVDPADFISGYETFRRMTDRVAELLAALAAPDWQRPTIRDLDVQGLVGHLIGVEDDFAATLSGDDRAGNASHVESTQASALRQRGRPPAETLREWQAAVGSTLAAVAAHGPEHREIRCYGVPLPLDVWLVVRAFELWIHDEDIRRATGRPVADPDPETLTRMTDVATLLLPAGVASVSDRPVGAHARLVLTGPGGGTWDVSLADGAVTRAQPGRSYDAHVVVDAAEFCRVVGNRASLERSGAIVRDDVAVADAVFAGAAALAFD